MAFVQFSQVSLAFGDRDILKNVTINLQTGSKVALTGANGAGKSTLIKVLAGLTPPDSGSRAVQKDSRKPLFFLRILLSWLGPRKESHPQIPFLHRR